MGTQFHTIGKLPGYNKNIDNNRSYENKLLQNINFIDMVPVTYSMPMLDKIFKIVYNAMGVTYNTNNNTNDKTIKQLYVYSASQDSANSCYNNYIKLLNRYVGKEITNFGGLKIVASSDSTVTDSIRNSVTENDFFDSSYGISNLHAKLKNNSVMNAIASGTSQITKINYGTALDIYSAMYGAGTKDLSELSTSDILTSMAKKTALGLNFALPDTIQSSAFDTTFSTFIKLTSPSGHINDIKKFVIEPTLKILLAASPISYDGLVYGMPLIWNIRAYGNTNYNVGIIESLVITRGSMETMYSDKLLPLSLDLRITFKSLSNHFSSILSDQSLDSLSEDSLVGMMTPGQYQHSLDNTLNTKVGITSGSESKIQIIQV